MQLPVDNNWNENQIRSIVSGRSNWLFASSLSEGQRAAVVKGAPEGATHLEARAICRRSGLGAFDRQPTLAHPFAVPLAVAGAAGVQAVRSVHLLAVQRKGVSVTGLWSRRI